MSDTTLVLHETQTGVADATGACVLQLGPTLQHEQWSDIYLSVGNSGVGVPQCRIYKGPAVASNYIQGTQHGTGDGAQLDQDLRRGQFVTVVWTGADVGSICTVSADGTKTLLGVRVYG